mgnify:CR=1 FL=1
MELIFFGRLVFLYSSGYFNRPFRFFLRLLLGLQLQLDGCQRHILQDGEIVEEIEVLKNHPHFAPRDVDIHGGTAVEILHREAVLLSLVLFQKIFLFDLPDDFAAQRFRIAPVFRGLPQRAVGVGFFDDIEMQIGIDRRQQLPFHPHFAVSGELQEIHAP